MAEAWGFGGLVADFLGLQLLSWVDGLKEKNLQVRHVKSPPIQTLGFLPFHLQTSLFRSFFQKLISIFTPLHTSSGSSMGPGLFDQI